MSRQSLWGELLPEHHDERLTDRGMGADLRIRSRCSARRHGRDAVRSYWTRQWAAIGPHVEPTSFSTGADGEVVAEVHQTVRDLQGALLADKMVGHIFRIENGLITRFDIRDASESGQAGGARASGNERRPHHHSNRARDGSAGV